MATKAPPKKNTATTFFVEVRSQADPTTFKSGPTIAAGDFKVSIDGGAYANLTTLPTAALTIITLTLSAAEMNGDEIKVQAVDVAGAEWAGRTWTYYTATQQINDLLATTGYTAPLTAATTRTALGLASANLDTQLSGIAASVDTEVLPASIRAALGLAAANLDTQLSTIAGYVDTEVLPASIRAALGLGIANLDTQLAAIAARTTNLPPDPADASDIAGAFATLTSALGALATAANLALVKAKTDQLTFTKALELDVNMQSINDVALTGSGVLAAEFKP